MAHIQIISSKKLFPLHDVVVLAEPRLLVVIRVGVAAVAAAVDVFVFVAGYNFMNLFNWKIYFFVCLEKKQEKKYKKKKSITILNY